MLYLLVSFGLIAAALFLYLRGHYVIGQVSRSGYIIMGVFAVTGLLMSSYSLQEIDDKDYEKVRMMTESYPQMQPMVDERLPNIYNFEYIELLETYHALKKKQP